MARLGLRSEVKCWMAPNMHAELVIMGTRGRWALLRDLGIVDYIERARVTKMKALFNQC